MSTATAFVSPGQEAVIEHHGHHLTVTCHAGRVRVDINGTLAQLLHGKPAIGVHTAFPGQTALFTVTLDHGNPRHYRDQ